MTLYLKYRPQKISELDLVSVRETLTKLLSKGDLPHAFLFAGPRGTGKTSSARILAKAINCEHRKEGSIEPCNECDTCRAITKGTHIDVIEMDAASNRGIDDVRALKQDIMLAPSISRKKVYIIDEVHMLTTEAANALLKTLEEPPSHVVFILATTDPQKLPTTVISRLSVVQFQKASEEEITSKLTRIAESEKFSVEDGVFKVIYGLSDGSFRDAVKVLEEVSLGSREITLELLNSRFRGGMDHAHSILMKLNEEGTEGAVQYLGELSKQGVDGKTLLNSFINEVHSELLKSVGVMLATPNIISQSDAVALLELLLEAKARLPYATSEFMPLEIALVKFKPTQFKEPEKKVQPLPTEKLKLDPRMEQKSVVEKKETVAHEEVQQKEKTDTVQTQVQTMPINSDSVDVDTWGRILVLTREKNGSVEALLRATKPRHFDGKNLTLGVYFQFHKERLEMPANRIIFEEILTGVFGCETHAVFSLEDPPAKPAVEQGLTQSREPDIINAAKEIFGN